MTNVSCNFEENLEVVPPKLSKSVILGILSCSIFVYYISTVHQSNCHIGDCDKDQKLLIKEN